MHPVLDLTAERCPMTFVRIRLALDPLTPPATLHVRLRGGQTLDNVTRSASALGCTVTPGAREGDDVTVAISKPPPG